MRFASEKRPARPSTGSSVNCGLVTKDDVEELELRIAQLEHRLRLLEIPEKGLGRFVQH